MIMYQYVFDIIRKSTVNELKSRLMKTYSFLCILIYRKLDKVMNYCSSYSSNSGLYFERTVFFLIHSQTPPQHGVVYTATTSCPVTFSSDSQAYRPSIPEAGSSCAGSNQAPGVPLNVTAGQKPAYPANWTMPPYQASYMRNPPPYEEIQNVTNEENLRSCDNATADEVPDTTDTEGNENEMRVLEEKQEEGNESNIDSISKVDTEDGHQSDAACFIESEDGDTNTRLAPKGETVNNASKELDPQEAEEAVTILENITNELMYQNVSPI